MPAKYVRLAIALTGVGLLVWGLPDSPTKGPILMIALGVPLIFRLVPRNIFYGTRTLRTLFTGPEEHWYRQNVITGIAMVGIGLVWLTVLVATS